MSDDIYVKVCPNCGSTNCSMTPEMTNLASGFSNLAGYYCLDCKFSGTFPEVKQTDVQEYTKHMSEDKQHLGKQVFYPETVKERQFYYVNKFFGRWQIIYWFVISLVPVMLSISLYNSGDTILGSIVTGLAIISCIVNYGMYKESTKYAQRGAYKEIVRTQYQQ